MRGLCLSVACIFMAAIMAVMLGGCTEGTGAGGTTSGDAAGTTAATTPTTEVKIMDIDPGLTTLTYGIETEYYGGALKLTYRYDDMGFQYYGMLDGNNKIILPPVYTSLYPISEDRICANLMGSTFSENSSWIFDASGNRISDGKFRSIRFLQKKDGTFGLGIGENYKDDGDAGIGIYLIDNDGNPLEKVDRFSTDYDDAGNELYTNKHIQIEKDGDIYLIDYDGKRVEM